MKPGSILTALVTLIIKLSILVRAGNDIQYTLSHRERVSLTAESHEELHRIRSG